MQYLDTIITAVKKITELAVALLALAIVLGVIFGDKVAFLPGNVIGNVTSIIGTLGSSGLVGLVAVGVLHSATPGNDYCNGNIAPIQSPIEGACMVDCLHVDDLSAILAEKGLDKRPAGK